MSAPDRGEMLDRADKTRSGGNARSLAWRAPASGGKKPANDNDAALMRRPNARSNRPSLWPGDRKKR
jgi:hypothetical protein